MKSIKLYAWGSAFMQKLNYVRNDMELKTLRKIGAAQYVQSTIFHHLKCLKFCFLEAIHRPEVKLDVNLC